MSGMQGTSHCIQDREEDSQVICHGEFTAIHRIMKCSNHGTLFRSSMLESLVSPHCTYANDIMVEAAITRFIKGYSCSEISSGLNNGISESHVRLLSNRRMDIFMEIHNDNIPKLKDAMNSYILQIDGTTDSEFAMVIVVRDAISGFTLYAEKCHSESFESVKGYTAQSKKEIWNTFRGNIRYACRYTGSP